ncbi:amino acid permease [Mycolicibacterium agri]|uniref:Amino acid permease n=1 Tax=Mycolicibacterium agri TaxID=36811 RepID=A0A2A7MQR6_MYCAG|nr:APC family permease [Mycolicibacterium agri]PEG34065.1 amino acid permease [Mycolicibacterium agri]GFG53103.1 amino acid permease [Mycolicibacterium agri]
MTTGTPAGAADEVDQIPRRRLPFWVALAFSVALVGPTLAMSGNGQGLVATVGKSIPLVFLIGLVGVSLVGYSFVRLTRHLNHAGSSYGLVGGTIGPRTGFFAGFAMLGAYWAFSTGTLALTAAFTNAFIAELQPNSENPYQPPWLVIVVIAAVISFLLSGRDIELLAKILLAIEGIGILAMLVLVAVIFGKGGAPSTGIDFSVFSFSGSDVSPSAVLAGVVAAFLSWAGFEACASMGEETDNPERNIPRALAGTLLLTGALFVVVMFAQVTGFGTDQAGLDAFQSSGNTLGDLGGTYIGQWFGLVIIFTAVVSAFGCHLATSATSGRMLYAFARDGFGPKALAHIHPATGGPRRATWLVVIAALVINMICDAIGWPDMGTGNDAIDTYFLFAVAGSACLMVCYLLVEIAAAWFVGSPKFLHVHGGRGKAAGLLLPLLGAVVIVVVLWFNVKDAESWSAAPLLGLYWCLVGLIIALAASGIAKRVGESLSTELNLKA